MDDNINLNKLNISDLNLLKITKVKPWAIYFTYDNVKYLLHADDEGYYNSLVLYKRIESNNKIKLKQISTDYKRCSSAFAYEYLDFYKLPTVYKHIDKTKFVAKMSLENLIMTDNEVVVGMIKKHNETLLKITSIQYEINILNGEINELKKEGLI